MQEIHETSSGQPGAAARMWDLGGEAYDRISFGISDALAHAAQRLNPKPSQALLDVATGTGWTARNLAAAGATVTAVDIAPALLGAAERLSAHCRPPIDFQLADAEQLPFGEARFDGVISTFGAMFAPDQKRAGAELARVCRPGGRLILATWVPGGAVARFFGVVAAYRTVPPSGPSPFAWGDREQLQALLGSAFDLEFEEGVSETFPESAEEVRHSFTRGFGPVREIIESLDAERLKAFQAALDAYHRGFQTPSGRLRIRREYLITIGSRR